ncbi:ferritin family protein [Petroclostridium xylanilyticum]|jgi:rubrerythrin|uniref:ferritin family protein n=1 Tax=Petroclostridium xylanilyticum TaxID=1792311 RepID=UPI001FA8A645|nr:ferritin family protein [Petroclostridium xylanilyticum]
MIYGNFNDLEIIKIAISMEEEGMNFYTSGAKYTSGKLRDFLLHAAGQEMAHKEKFTRLYNEFLEKKNGFNDEYLFEPDVAAYLKSMVENQVFSKKPKTDDAFKDLKTAVADAVQAEETTAALYTQMYEGAKYQEVKNVLAILIEEEKEHAKYFKGILEEISKQS